MPRRQFLTGGKFCRVSPKSRSLILQFQYTSKVTSCTKAEFHTLIDGKKTKVDGYEVICEDTVLFPEGGGQASFKEIQIYKVYFHSQLYSLVIMVS